MFRVPAQEGVAAHALGGAEDRQQAANHPLGDKRIAAVNLGKELLHCSHLHSVAFLRTAVSIAVRRLTGLCAESPLRPASITFACDHWTATHGQRAIAGPESEQIHLIEKFGLPLAMAISEARSCQKPQARRSGFATLAIPDSGNAAS
jgi:hypothetical protein